MAYDLYGRFLHVRYKWQLYRWARAARTTVLSIRFQRDRLYDDQFFVLIWYELSQPMTTVPLFAMGRAVSILEVSECDFIGGFFLDRAFVFKFYLRVPNCQKTTISWLALRLAMEQ